MPLLREDEAPPDQPPKLESPEVVNSCSEYGCDMLSAPEEPDARISEVEAEELEEEEVACSKAEP